MKDKNAKKSKGATTPPSDATKANTVDVKEQPGKSRERVLAELGLSPIMANANTARKFAASRMGELHLNDCIDVMCDKAELVKAGNLTEAEMTLMAQAVTLDTIFNELARRAALNMGEYLNATDTYLRLALKAQSQCRSTLETLAEIKNPRPVAFVKQANIAHGPQQVNNGTAQGTALAHAGKTANPSNELLSVNDGERLDTRTQGTAGTANPELVPVGKIDGTKE